VSIELYTELNLLNTQVRLEQAFRKNDARQNDTQIPDGMTEQNRTKIK
jgi:hypothetical protein